MSGVVGEFGGQDGFVAFGAVPAFAESSGEQVAFLAAAGEGPLVAFGAFVDG